MAQEVIALWGVRVASVERDARIRHSFAFDLRDVDLRHRPLRSAALEWPAAVTPDATRVRLSDPSQRVLYGLGRPADEWPLSHVELSPAAVADLQRAAGAFFSVDAEFDADACGPSCLAGRAEQRLVLFAIADVASGTEAAASDAVSTCVSAA